MSQSSKVRSAARAAKVRASMKSSYLLALSLVLLCAHSASASFEINGLFDGRSLAMGGTGVAFLDSPAAVPTNPALLEQIKTLSVSLNAYLIASRRESPYTVYHLSDDGMTRYRTWDTFKFKRNSPAPIPFLGGAYRLHDRVVAGLAAYPLLGSGAEVSYRPAPEERPNLELKPFSRMFMVEFAPAVSVRVLDNLSLGVSWRVTYMSFVADEPFEDATSPVGVTLDGEEPVYRNLNYSALNFKGVQIGLLYRPIPALRIGLSYRNKVVLEGEGTVKFSGVTVDSTQDVANPHAIRGGVAFSFLNDKALVAADFKYLMYKEAWKQTVIKIQRAGAPDEAYASPTHWKDAISALVGGEYKVIDLLALRAGYTLSTTGSNPKYISSSMPPLGLSHQVAVGAGIAAMDSLNVDLSLAYITAGGKVTKATYDADGQPLNAGIGTYANTSYVGGVSVVYHR